MTGECTGRPIIDYHGNTQFSKRFSIFQTIFKQIKMCRKTTGTKQLTRLKIQWFQGFRIIDIWILFRFDTPTLFLIRSRGFNSNAWALETARAWPPCLLIQSLGFINWPERWWQKRFLDLILDSKWNDFIFSASDFEKWNCLNSFSIGSHFFMFEVWNLYCQFWKVVVGRSETCSTSLTAVKWAC